MNKQELKYEQVCDKIMACANETEILNVLLEQDKSYDYSQVVNVRKYELQHKDTINDMLTFDVFDKEWLNRLFSSETSSYIELSTEVSSCIDKHHLTIDLTIQNETAIKLTGTFKNMLSFLTDCCTRLPDNKSQLSASKFELIRNIMTSEKN